MNRSGRRALAVSLTVAVGVVFAGAVGTGPAAADGDPGGIAARGSDTDAAAGNAGPRRIERTSRDPRAAGRGSWQRPDNTEVTAPIDKDTDTDSDHPGWDCHWPDWNPVLTPSAGIGVGGGGGGGGIIVAAAGIGAPLIASPPVSGTATNRMLTGVAPAQPDAAAPAPPAIAPMAGPPPPSPAPPPAVAPAPPVASALRTAPPVAPAVDPQPAAAQVNPIRLGYPAYLQSASVAEITALAFLGVAGLVTLAGVGGFVGYRQARSGFALRAAGTARFLS